MLLSVEGIIFLDGLCSLMTLKYDVIMMSLWYHYDIMDEIEKCDWLTHGLIFLEMLSQLKIIIFIML